MKARKRFEQQIRSKEPALSKKCFDGQVKQVLKRRNLKQVKIKTCDKEAEPVSVRLLQYLNPARGFAIPSLNSTNTPIAFSARMGTTLHPVVANTVNPGPTLVTVLKITCKHSHPTLQITPINQSSPHHDTTRVPTVKFKVKFVKHSHKCVHEWSAVKILSLLQRSTPHPS
ncbi:hypothetical protein WN944_000678 [Citrus x changshan-huyou]|uniref:Uncharacterized protein n=1 Tax=Citrus x changshan-huyou TaxID=2935761 RepID=A0AAP0MFT7_9ROSI